MVERSPDGWLVTYQPNPHARLRLFCLAYAGAGASVFNPWRKRLADDIELTAIQLPGREERRREPLPRRITDLMPRLLDAIAPRLDRPYALLGYSLGALLAYDLARQIAAHAGLLQPAHLFPLARLAPHLKDPLPPFYDRPEDEFLAELQRRYGPLPPTLLNTPDMLGFYLPIVRADLEMVDTYEAPAQQSLACPVTAIGGADDVWTEEQLIAWKSVTTGPFRHHLLPGGHFFLRDQRDALCQFISETLK